MGYLVPSPFSSRDRSNAKYSHKSIGKTFWYKTSRVYLLIQSYLTPKEENSILLISRCGPCQVPAFGECLHLFRQCGRRMCAYQERLTIRLSLYYRLQHDKAISVSNSFHLGQGRLEDLLASLKEKPKEKPIPEFIITS